MYFTYIVTNKHNNVLYIGVTGHLEGRIHEHRERLTEGFTKQYQVSKLVFYEDYPDPRSAIAREKQLKGWRRAKKIALIERLNPRWLDLFEAMIDGMILIPNETAVPNEPIVRGPSTATGQAGLTQDDSSVKSLSRREGGAESLDKRPYQA
jgi:putative endonuclease